MKTKSTTSQKRAREIMGKNFFGIEEAIQHFGVNPTRQQTLVLSEIPFSEAVLQETKETYILVAIFPLSILEIHGKMDSKLFYDQSWYNKESFSKKHSEASWQLIRKTPVDNSFGKNWEEQQALLGEDDKVPTAQAMIYTIIGYYLTTNERLFKNIYVRTSSVDSDSCRVVIGYFFSVCLYSCSYFDDFRCDVLGVSSARKWKF